MNFRNMQEELWWLQNSHEQGNRPDFKCQLIRNAINQALNDIKNETHFWRADIVRGSIAVVAGTYIYQLDDFCLLPIRLWTEDQDAHEVDFINEGEMARSGLRIPTMLEAASGPYNYTAYQRLQTALLTVNGNIANATPTFTAGSGTPFLTAHIGRRVRINGEQADYTIKALGGASPNAVATLDRNYVSQLTGNGTSNIGPDMTGVNLEIGPPTVWQLEFRPIPVDANTVSYTFVKQWRTLLNDAEMPGLEERWHQHVLAGAKKYLYMWLQDKEGAATWDGIFRQGLMKMRETDWPSYAPGRIQFNAPIVVGPNMKPPRPDQRFRGR